MVFVFKVSLLASLGTLLGPFRQSSHLIVFILPMGTFLPILGMGKLMVRKVN